MANNPYATSKQAADSVGITPGDIGVAANDYVRKKELIATNKFDADSLASYGNNDYVMLKDIAKGAFQVTLSVNSDVTSRGTVQINNGTAGATATAEVNVEDQVTAKCNLLKSGDVFDGWYSGSSKVSSNATYTFTAQEAVSLVAKINYLDVTPTSLDYDAAGGSKTFQVSTNVPWTVS
jgi:hypothetical protein